MSLHVSLIGILSCDKRQGEIDVKQWSLKYPSLLSTSIHWSARLFHVYREKTASLSSSSDEEWTSGDESEDGRTENWKSTDGVHLSKLKIYFCAIKEQTPMNEPEPKEREQNMQMNVTCNNVVKTPALQSPSKANPFFPSNDTAQWAKFFFSQVERKNFRDSIFNYARVGWILINKRSDKRSSCHKRIFHALCGMELKLCDEQTM